jgi:nucleoside-diphosphate-sugar epimerase
MPSVKGIKTDRNLECVTIPSLLADVAFDEGMGGATYVIHLASPIEERHDEDESYTRTLVEPAVKGTLNILEAVKKAGTTRRVVITSFIEAIISEKFS